VGTSIRISILLPREDTLKKRAVIAEQIAILLLSKAAVVSSNVTNGSKNTWLVPNKQSEYNYSLLIRQRQVAYRTEFGITFWYESEFSVMSFKSD